MRLVREVGPLEEKTDRERRGFGEATEDPQALLLRGQARYRQRDWDGAIADLELARRLFARGGDVEGEARCCELLARLYEERRLRIKGASPPDLRVYCLGSFKVYRGQTEVGEEEWRMVKGATHKIKALMAFLVHRGEKGASRDELLDLLWPEQDALRASARLYSAIHALRKVLQPELRRGRNSAYIWHKGDRYRLNLGEGGWVDADAFEAHLQRARQWVRRGEKEVALQEYRKAEALYRGEYMAGLSVRYVDDHPSHWCMGRRIRLQEMYLEAISFMAHHYEEVGDDEGCLAYVHKMLGVDEGYEEAYRLAMKVAYRVGNRWELSRWYRLYRKVAGGLGGPSPDMEALYRHLLNELK